jgi:hypothetical protein
MNSNSATIAPPHAIVAHSLFPSTRRHQIKIASPFFYHCAITKKFNGVYSFILFIDVVISRLFRQTYSTVVPFNAKGM